MNLRELYPDLILINAQIYPMDQVNRPRPAMAVKDGRILALGGDDLREAAGPNTQMLDLEGKAVIPGIFDSHNHLLEVGAKLAHLRLDECRSSAEMMELVRERAQSTPPGTWIIGQGWNEEHFPGRCLPTRLDIDPATAEHPVILMRFFNTDLVNSVALRTAGIDRHTPDPESGRIERDANGEPNGLLRASAKMLVRSLLPRPTLAEMKAALQLACAEMHRFGITSVVEPGLYPYEMQAYQSFYQDGELTVRVNLMPSWHGFHDDESEAELDQRARSLGIFTGLGDEWLRLGGLKMAIDGGTSPHTAYMYQPFEGESEVINYNRISVEQLHRYLRTAQELGWDVGFHCCGDRAQDMVVDALAQVALDVPRPEARHNIIHAYFPTQRALQQMAEHRIAAVLQPTFLYWEGDAIFHDVGHERAQNYKPARKYLDHGVVVASSSDVTSTVSANPFASLYALVTRKNNLGHKVAPQEAISREEALRTYTTAGTWLTREEAIKGGLEPGKVADMVVLDRDYFAVPAEEIKDIQVDMTLVAGRVLWQR